MNIIDILYTITMNNFRNICLTTGLSFLLGFYSMFHLFLYMKHLEYSNIQNSNSLKQLKNVLNEYEDTLNEYENKCNKLQFKVINLSSEVDRLKKILKKVKSGETMFISSEESEHTLDSLNVSEDNENGLICDELCDLNKDLEYEHNIHIQQTKPDSQVSSPMSLFESSYVEVNIENQTDIVKDDDLSTNLGLDINQSTSSETLNKLKNVFGYQLVKTSSDEENLSKSIVLSKRPYFSENNIEVNRIIQEEKGLVVSTSEKLVKRHTMNDMNWVDATKKFIFG